MKYDINSILKKWLKVKMLLPLFLLLLTIQTPCFAEDIYIGTYDDAVFYLKTDSLLNTMNVVTGNPIVTASIKYKVSEIPNEEGLKKLQELCFDNTITHREREYTVLMHYDRIKKEWETEIPWVNINNSRLITTNYKVTYEQNITSHLVCFLNSKKQADAKHIDTFNLVLELLRSDMQKYYKWVYDK